MLEYDNSLRRQSFNLPILLEEQKNDLMHQTGNVFHEEEIRGIGSIILTGCGDSYATGMALRYTLEDLTGIPVELVTAIDFSSCYSRQRLNEKTLVIIVSISGNGVRVKEVVQKANDCNAMTLGITKDRNSDVGSNARRLIELHISPFERGPGNRNYFVSLLSLLYLGIHMGYVRGLYTNSTKKEYEKAMEAQGRELEYVLPEMDRKLLEIAGVWRDFPAFDFVGAGIDYASAWFGHGKVMEASGAFATHMNSEEWFHMNNFFRDSSHCGTIFIASTKNKAFARTREAIEYAGRIGRPMLVITDGDEEDFKIQTDYIKVPFSEVPFTNVLTHYIPVCILAGYMGAMLHERNCRGCLGPWEFAAGGAFIKHSEAIKD